MIKWFKKDEDPSEILKEEIDGVNYYLKKINNSPIYMKIIEENNLTSDLSKLKNNKENLSKLNENRQEAVDKIAQNAQLQIIETNQFFSETINKTLQEGVEIIKKINALIASRLYKD